MSTAALWRGRAEALEHAAARLALAGSALGLAAGAAELAVGPSIRGWVGDKQDTTRLGLVTLALAGAALVAALALRGPSRRVAGRRLLVAMALLLPGLIGFTTVGRLWNLPGPLLLAGGALVLAGTDRRELTAAFSAPRRQTALLMACAVLYVALGLTAAGWAGGLGVVGGAVVLTVPRIAAARPRAAHAAVVVAVLPFAVATWWSIVVPGLALLILALGHGVIRRAATARRQPSQRLVV